MTKDDWVNEAFRRTLARDATPSELERNTAFLSAQEEAYQSLGGRAAATALADPCRVMFCLNEFIYVP